MPRIALAQETDRRWIGTENHLAVMGEPHLGHELCRLIRVINHVAKISGRPLMKAAHRRTDAHIICETICALGAGRVLLSNYDSGHRQQPVLEFWDVNELSGRTDAPGG